MKKDINHNDKKWLCLFAKAYILITIDLNYTSQLKSMHFSPFLLF